MIAYIVIFFYSINEKNFSSWSQYSTVDFQKMYVAFQKYFLSSFVVVGVVKNLNFKSFRGQTAMQYSFQVSTTENKSNYRVFVGIILDRMSENTVIHDRCVRGTRLSILFALHVIISSSHCFFQLNSSNKAVILI